MKKLLLTSIVLVATLICFAQPARVQIINNSPDSTYNMLDVYIEQGIEANDLMYKGATAFKDIPQTGLPIRISVAPPMGVFPMDTFYSIVTTLTPGGKYVLVLNGTKEQTRYKPARPFKIDIYSGAKETASNPQETDILFAHGSPDLGTSDLRIGLKLIEDNLSFGNVGTGYKNFQSMLPPPAQRILRVTNQSGNKTLSAHLFNLLPLAGKAVVALTSGFMDPTVNRDGPQFSFIVVLANGQVMDFGASSSDVSRFQLIHNSADSKTSSVDVYINDSLALNNFSFRTATPFVDIFANTNLTIGIAPSTSATVADTFYSTEIYLDPEKTYISVLHGLESTTGYTPLRPLEMALNENGRETGMNTSMADVMVFHGGTDAPDIDIRDAGNATLINDLGYGRFSNYLQLTPTPTTINVTDASGNFLRRYNAVLTPFGGQAGTVVASGFMDTAANSKGPKFGLYLALPTGGALVPLQDVSVSVNDVEGAIRNARIFPNPVTNRIHIAGDLSANANAVVYDITGKDVMQLHNLSKGADISQLTSGLYILKIQDGSNLLYQKFTKQ